MQKSSLCVKLEGVSLISNIEYSGESLHLWRAYGIGPGKNIPLAKLDVAQVAEVPNLTECHSKRNKDISEGQFLFLKVKPRAQSSLKDAQKCSDSEKETVDDESHSLLFSCPEEGCIKTYQHPSALQHHLDCGRHERTLEHETLLDRAVYGYAQRLQEQSGGVPHMQEVAKSRNVSDQPCLLMGWAL